MLPTGRSASRWRTGNRAGFWRFESGMEVRSGGRRVGGSARCGVGLGARPADTEDLQLVLAALEAVGAADLAEQGGDAGADELDHPAAAAAGHVVVALAGVQVLVEVAAAGKPHFVRQAGLYEELEIAIHRGAGDRETPAMHRRENGVGVDVPVLCEDLANERPPFGRRAQTAGAQVPEKLFLFACRCHGIETLSQQAETILDGFSPVCQTPSGWPA